MSINDLGLIEEELPPVDPGDLPAQGYAFLQPKGYIFTLPKITDEDIKEPLVKVESITGAAQAQIVKVKFSGKHALQVGNQQFSASLSNRSRMLRGVSVNDLAYLAGATGYPDVLRSNRDYIKALQAAAGKSFKADVELNASCRSTHDIYDDTGEQVLGVKGCGQEWHLRAYKKKNGKQVVAMPKASDGSYAETFPCNCGAYLRAFPNLSNIRAV